MQRDKTDLLVQNTTCPPIPHPEIERKVYVTAVPSSSSLRYVFNTVMTGQRGAIGWDPTGDNLILYLKIEKQDNERFPDLSAGTEVWAVFYVRSGQ